MNSCCPLFATAYLPPIAFFAELMRHSAICIEQFETFPKQTYRNRTIILTANGTLPLVVPITHPYGNHTRTNNVGISYAERWNVNHWRAIVSAYSASPYFLYYKDPLESILMHHYDRLIDLNDALLKLILKSLKITTLYTYSTDYLRSINCDTDYRNVFSPKKDLPITFPPYSQVFETKMPFAPNLSILDLLFNLGPDAKRYLSRIPPIIIG